MKKIFLYLQLMRFPLVFTALSDTTAAYLIAFSWKVEILPFCLFLCLSAGLYTGGMVMNDMADGERDREIHPHRPLPSSKITRQEALFLLLFLCAFSATAALLLPFQRWIYILLTFLSIVGYNFFFKKSTLWGPLFMGLCRYFHFCIPGGNLSLPGVILFLYVVHLTLVSLLEKEWKGWEKGYQMPLFFSFLLIPWSFAAPCLKIWLLAILPLIAGLLWISLRLKKNLPPGLCVRDLILGLIYLDACLLWTWTGEGMAFLLLLWALPSLGMRAYRYFACPILQK